MKKFLFVMSLALSLSAGNVQAEDSQTRSFSGPYYLYNVTYGQYLNVSGDAFSLSDRGTAVELSCVDEKTEKYEIAVNGKKLTTSFQGDIALLSGNADEDTNTNWMLKPTDEAEVYAIGCVDNTAGSVEYLYYSSLGNVFAKQYAEPSIGGQWKLQAAQDQIVTLDETSDSYVQPTLEEATRAVVHLKRTFTIDSWNSLCLPFAVSSDQLKAQLGDDVKAGELIAYDATTGTLQFKYVTSLEAGKPYLVRPTKAPANLLNYYVFDDVTAFSTTTTTSQPEGSTVQYIGSFAKGTAPMNSYVLRKNDIYHLPKEQTMKGFRGYFIQNNPNAAPLQFWAIDETPTDIRNVFVGGRVADIYTIGGTLVRSNATSAKGLAKGVYVVDGEKFTVK